MARTTNTTNLFLLGGAAVAAYFLFAPKAPRITAAELPAVYERATSLDVGAINELRATGAVPRDASEVFVDPLAITPVRQAAPGIYVVSPAVAGEAPPLPGAEGLMGLTGLSGPLTVMTTPSLPAPRTLSGVADYVQLPYSGVSDYVQMPYNGLGAAPMRVKDTTPSFDNPRPGYITVKSTPRRW